MLNTNINYGLNDSKIVRVINFCLLKFEFNKQNEKIVKNLYNILYDISKDVNNIKDREEFFHRIEKILLKKYYKYDIWKVIIILMPLSKLCNVDIGYLIGTHIIELLKNII